MHTSLLLQCNYKLTVLNRIITILTIVNEVAYSFGRIPAGTFTPTLVVLKCTEVYIHTALSIS